MIRCAIAARIAAASTRSGRNRAPRGSFKSRETIRPLIRRLIYLAATMRTDLNDLPLTDPALRPIAERVIAGEPLSYDDGVALYISRDIHGIGRLANVVRQRLHGDA